MANGKEKIDKKSIKMMNQLQKEIVADYDNLNITEQTKAGYLSSRAFFYNMKRQDAVKLDRVIKMGLGAGKKLVWVDIK